MELLTNFRNVGDYKNMSRKQIENVVAKPSAPKRTLKAKAEPRSTSKEKRNSPPK